MPDKNFKIDIDLENQVLAILERPEFENRVMKIIDKWDKKKKAGGVNAKLPPTGGQFWSNVGLPRDDMK